MEFNEVIYEKRWNASELEIVGAVWQVLVSTFFQQFIDPESAVLDIGCGYCHFINNIAAKERVGVDANPLVKEYCSTGVTFHCTSDLSLSRLGRNHFDWIFMSNFLEHLDNYQVVLQLLKTARELLKPHGGLLILQPNFRLLGASYFDFVDHKTIITDRNLEEALDISGFKLIKKILRFLPYTTKSKIPKRPGLVRLYLRVKPLWALMGKQSLFIATSDPAWPYCKRND